MGAHVDYSHNRILRRLLQKIIAIAGGMLIAVAAIANPVVDNVAAGDVVIQQSGDHTEVTQTSQKGIVNWQSFNINQQESTHFQQPAGGITLNRISPNQGPSQVYGKLSSTGQIILVNPAGIFFGPTARVDVASIIATTANISDKNFMNGNYLFDQPSAYSGAVINEGVIRAAQNGLVALAATAVRNDGLIEAKLGHVVLAAGEAFTVSFAGNELISFTVDKATTGLARDQNNQVMRDGVANTGKMIADGGHILLTADAATNVLDSAINMTGIVQAQSVAEHNGEIIFSADAGGVVKVAGTVNASSQAAGTKGGTVAITGGRIQLASALIDTSGDWGGGDIFIGGNYQGKGPLLNALTTTVDSASSLLANALTQGDGGHIIVWSDYATAFNGAISATGGANSGNGGFAETSGHYLSVNGARVNLSAPRGAAGTWLLDPTDVTITTSASSNESYSGGTYTPSGDSANILASDLMSNLGSSNVLVTTTSGGAGTGNISVQTPITWATTNTLTLNAANNITIDSNGASAMIAATAGGGLTLTAGSAITINGGITLTPTTTSNALLTLTAADSASSITTGANGAISVGNFSLTQGRWNQVTASLPAFAVTTSFQLASGAIPPTGVSFIRATSGDGVDATTPYVLTDIYGVQGMNSSATLRASFFKLGSNIDASSTSTWNSSSGFVPIGTDGAGFSGGLDGQNYTVSDLNINRSTNWIGFFGATSGTASITNLILSSPVITGGLVTGGLVSLAKGSGTGSTVTISNIGIPNPTIKTNSASTSSAMGGFVGIPDSENVDTINISNSYVVGGTVTGYNNVGGFVGNNGGTIQNSYSTAAVTASASSTDRGTGGFAGRDASYGTISKSYSSGTVSGPALNLGGFLGVLEGGGTISNNFWDTESSGVATSTAGGTGKTTAQMMTLSTFTEDRKS